MRPCTRVGIDCTWRCNWQCGHCFYLRNSNLHRPIDEKLYVMTRKIDQAKEGGLDHVVFVGWGEPSLGKNTLQVMEYAHSLGMATSMITNGSTGIGRFKTFMREGMDHLHISSHGLDDELDDLVGWPGAFAKQAELKEWLAAEELPFRTNVTMQQRNYHEIPDLAEFEIEHRVFHFVFLGFLPHYEWHNHVNDVAVHPADLRPYIEDGADKLLDAGTYFTIRYHPLCHLAPKYWPYVVNARYVFFDPWEWNYSLQVTDLDSLWGDSRRCGESVACQEPCSKCSAYFACGGWNRTYAAAFGGADLKPIMEPPDAYKDVWGKRGGLHDLNPVNQLSGTIQTALR